MNTNQPHNNPGAGQADISRRGFLLAAAAVTSLVITGCDGQSSPSSGSGTQGSGKPADKPAGADKPQSTDKPEPIRIGAFLSLTGAQAAQAKQIKIGSELAVKQINEAGGVLGRPVELVIQDTRGIRADTGTAVVRLIERYKVCALLGECASSLSIIGGNIAQQYKTPMISPTSTSPKVSQTGDMVFTLAFVDTFQGQVGAKFAVDRLKAKTAAILFDHKQAYCVSLRDAFVKSFKELGGEIKITQSYTTGDAEFSPQILNLKAAGADMLFLAGYSADAGLIAQQMKSHEFSPHTLGGDGLDSPDFWTVSRGTAQGWYATSFFTAEDENPQAVAFIKKFTDATGHTPSSASVQAYDAARVLIDAIARAGNTNGVDIARELAATKNYPGALGPLTMGPQRTVDKPALVLRMDNGKWIKVAEYPNLTPSVEGIKAPATGQTTTSENHG